jgi:RND superfamily putative drug exporter
VPRKEGHRCESGKGQPARGSAEVFLKLMGVGMATAILIDATVVRMLLVHALMQLLGGDTCWIPAGSNASCPASTWSPPPLHRLLLSEVDGRSAGQ